MSMQSCAEVPCSPAVYHQERHLLPAAASSAGVQEPQQAADGLEEPQQEQVVVEGLEDLRAQLRELRHQLTAKDEQLVAKELQLRAKDEEIELMRARMAQLEVQLVMHHSLYRLWRMELTTHPHHKVL